MISERDIFCFPVILIFIRIPYIGCAAVCWISEVSFVDVLCNCASLLGGYPLGSRPRLNCASVGVLELEFDGDGAPAFEDADRAVCSAGLCVAGVVDGLEEAVKAVDHFVGYFLSFGVSCLISNGDRELVRSNAACVYGAV